MNIKSLLSKSILELQKVGIPTPEIDAKVLLLSAMEKNSSFVYSHPDFLITNAQYSKFRRYIRKRKTGEPIAYIVGHKEFYGYNFFVNKNVLVPRPESEWLVEQGIEQIKKSKYDIRNTTYNVLDMGTGSGCIAIALFKELTTKNYQLSTRIYAVDFSSRAVAVAKKNAQENKAENIVFLNSNLFSNRRIKNKIFDLIIGNLPYVPHGKKTKIKSAIDFEPKEAIFAEDNGAAIIKKFLLESKSHTKPGSTILIELDPRNAKDLSAFAQAHYPTANIDPKRDLAGLDRYLMISI